MLLYSRAMDMNGTMASLLDFFLAVQFRALGHKAFQRRMKFDMRNLIHIMTLINPDIRII